MSPFIAGLLYGCIIGTSVTLALVVLAVYVRAEWAHRDAELQRAWDRERES